MKKKIIISYYYLYNERTRVILQSSISFRTKSFYIIFIYNFVTILNFFVIKKETREKRLIYLNLEKYPKIFYLVTSSCLKQTQTRLNKSYSFFIKKKKKESNLSTLISTEVYIYMFDLSNFEFNLKNIRSNHPKFLVISY